MSSPQQQQPQQIPPWLQQQFEQLQQLQHNLQMIQIQKQHVESERIESEKALEELKKAGDDQTVYKQAGSILIKSTKADLIGTLEERKTLAVTRSQVLAKQEGRLKESLKIAEKKITSMIKGGPGTVAPAPATDGSGAARPAL